MRLVRAEVQSANGSTFVDSGLPSIVVPHHNDLTMRRYVLKYLFNGQSRTHLFELDQTQLPLHEAAMHLLQLHFGDAENGLIMPLRMRRQRRF
jgi:hypothetical protein